MCIRGTMNTQLYPRKVPERIQSLSFNMHVFYKQVNPSEDGARQGIVAFLKLELSGNYFPAARR
jgi:hypothetical protein